MHIVFYFTTHRSFVFYYTALSGFCILVLIRVCQTVLKVFWRLVWCVVVCDKNWYFILQHTTKIAFILQPFYLLGLLLCCTTHTILTFILPHDTKHIFFFAAQYTIQAFIVPHAYDVNFYFTALQPKNSFILPRFLILSFKILHLKICFYILFYHADIK